MLTCSKKLHVLISTCMYLQYVALFMLFIKGIWHTIFLFVGMTSPLPSNFHPFSPLYSVTPNLSAKHAPPPNLLLYN